MSVQLAGNHRGSLGDMTGNKLQTSSEAQIMHGAVVTAPHAPPGSVPGSFCADSQRPAQCPLSAMIRHGSEFEVISHQHSGFSQVTSMTDTLSHSVTPTPDTDLGQAQQEGGNKEEEEEQEEEEEFELEVGP